LRRAGQARCEPSHTKQRIFRAATGIDSVAKTRALTGKSFCFFFQKDGLSYCWLNPNQQIDRPHDMALSTLRADPPLTRDRRRALLARAALTAPLAEAHRDALLAASAMDTCAPGTVLFTAGDAPRDVFLVGSGFVQMRMCAASDPAGEAVEPAMHVRLAGAGQLAAGPELARLAAGHAATAPHRQAAVVMGAPAEIVAIRQTVFARVLAEDAQARERVADEALRAFAAMEKLAAELATLKSFGKVRLARFLLELFDQMGRPCPGVLELPQSLSHSNIAAALGLTRRSVVTDMLALEDFDAIDHDRSGRLTLRDRARLARIASLGESDDREDNADAWRRDVAAALAADDTLHAFELAREALLYHARDAELRYSAVLAALRAGALDEAGQLIAAFRYSAESGEEREAALVARALKDRAFASADRDALAAHAGVAAAAYLAVHRSSGGSYPALNAAAMQCIAGETEAGQAVARGIAQRKLMRDAGYWDLATLAEACWLIGDDSGAASALRRAHAAGDADDGKRATTRRQLRRLGAALNRNVSGLLAALPVRRVAVLTAPPDRAWAERHRADPPAKTLVVVGDTAGAAWLGLETLPGLAFVLAAPSGTVPARPFAADGPLHIADETTGACSPARLRHAWRHALGLALLHADEHEAPLPALDDSEASRHAWPGWAAPDSLAEGQTVLLWAEGAAVPAHAMAAAPEAAEAAGGTLLRFARLSDAVAVAEGLAVLALRLCLDVENLTNRTLDAARLARLQPAIRAGAVFATDTAAAELALLGAPLRLTCVGRMRSQRKLNRTQLWAVRPAAPWH
jgi:CRP-like cAMP-binding protein